MPNAILIIGGDRWQRETLAAALAYEGFQASHTEDEAAALKMVAQQSFRLVLVNAAASWETVEQLVLQQPNLPLVVLSPAIEPRRKGPAPTELPLNFPALLRAIRRALSQPAETYVMSLAPRDRSKVGPSRPRPAAVAEPPPSSFP